MNPAEIRQIFTPEGKLGKMEGYEYRKAQADLAEFAAAVFGEGQHGMAEAPTGTGKTLAYLIPAIAMARKLQRPSVIATATISLQDQLVTKDAQRVALVVPNVKVVALKGRANYLCPSKVEQLEDGPSRRILKAAIARGLVERGDMPISVSDVWWSVNAGGCTNGTCERCPLKEARQAAEGADVVVANHALLVADRDRRVLPEYGVLVIDEAHRLVDTTTEALTVTVKVSDFEVLERLNLPGLLHAEALDIKTACQGLLAQIQAIAETYPRQSEDSRVAIPPQDPPWLAIAEEGRGLVARIAALAAQIEACGAALSRQTASQCDRIYELAVTLADLFKDQDAEHVRWADVDHGSISVAPLRVDRHLRTHLWSHATAVLAISATLATTAGFDRRPYGMKNGIDFAAPSPFDYPNQCLLAIPSQANPEEPTHPSQVGAVALALASRLHGRTMVLFTSYAALQTVDKLLRGRCAAQGLTLLAQGVDGERKELLERFQEGGSILLGTSSYWEGIDLVGDKLSALVIARLPFDVPSDPVHAARGQLYSDPFFEYSLPRASTRLRQGFGRLIRSETDRGVVVIMDTRLRSKPYGQMLASMLPPCTLFTGRLQSLPALFDRFMAPEALAPAA